MPVPAILTTARALLRDRRGNVAILSALAMPVLIGSLGIGAEVASWYGGKRSLQNAADSAAIAAATNGTDGGYAVEAKAVAAQYGFKNGDDGVTVAAEKGVPCPGGGNDCYRVTITKLQPLFFSQIVGFKGDVEGSLYKRLASTAVAVQGMGPREYCVLALASDGTQQALLTHGSPFADLSGCNVMSNTDAVCTGHDLNADVGDAHGENRGCGKKRNENVETVADPYAELAKNIPDVDCPKGYWKAPDKPKKGDTIPSDNSLSGPRPETLLPFCGDLIASGQIVITQPNTVLVIKNGSFDLRGSSLITTPGASLTIIFTGDDMSRVHAPVGNGKFDFEAPKTGTWKGIAMYQDPKLTDGVDVKEAGNEPTWNITGLAYMPHASVTLSGAVSKSGNGAKCFAMVVNDLTINGTGAILANGECKKAGLELPKGQAPTRGELVS